MKKILILLVVILQSIATLFAGSSKKDKNLLEDVDITIVDRIDLDTDSDANYEATESGHGNTESIIEDEY